MTDFSRERAEGGGEDSLLVADKAKKHVIYLIGGK
jgi:hypothetical protein